MQINLGRNEGPVLQSASLNVLQFSEEYADKGFIEMDYQPYPINLNRWLEPVIYYESIIIFWKKNPTVTL